MTSPVWYQVVCPHCGFTYDFPSEVDFEDFVGPSIKAMIDNGNQANAVATAAVLASAASAASHSTASATSTGARSCDRCKQEIALVNENVRRIITSAESNKLPVGGGNSTSTTSFSAASQVDSVLQEEIQSYEETDPLVLALQKSKSTNEFADVSDLNALMTTYRWLIAPVHAFLRVFVFRTLIPADMHIIGNVTFYVEPKSSSSAGRKKLTFISSRLFPLAFSPDLAFCELPLIVSVLIVVMNFMITRYFVLPFSNNHHQVVENDDDHLHHTLLSLSYLVAILSFSAMYFMFRVILREPGFLLPKNPELYFDQNDSLLEIARNRKNRGPAQHHHHHNSKQADTILSGGAGGKYCSACHITRPPRATHCKLNHLCCTEQDHHCTALGAAIGRRNGTFFGYFVLCAFFGIMMNWVQLVCYVKNFESLITKGGYLFLVISFVLSFWYQYMTWIWMKSFWGGILKGLTTKEQNKLNRHHQEQLMKEKGYEVPPSPMNNSEGSDSLPVPQPGNPLSRVIAYFVRPTPPSEFCAESLERDSDSSTSSSTSMV